VPAFGIAGVRRTELNRFARSGSKFVWCEAVERLQLAAEIGGADELLEMATKLLVVVVVVSLYSRFLDGPVHPLDLTIIRHDDSNAQLPGLLLFDGAIVRPSGPGASGARECGQADP
jgi:hypothetical protein